MKKYFIFHAGHANYLLTVMTKCQLRSASESPAHIKSKDIDDWDSMHVDIV